MDASVRYFGGSISTPTVRSHRRLIRRTVLLSLAAALLSVGIYQAWAWISHTKLFEVRTITINGVHYGDVAAVLTRSGLNEGQSMADADVEMASVALNELPWIESVSVSRRWPHAVDIEVNERDPLATVTVGDHLWAVDQLGMILPPWRSGAMPDVPRIVGAWPGLSTALKDSVCRSGGQIDPAGAHRAVGWIRVLEGIGPAAVTEISEVDVRDSSFTLLILAANGLSLKLPAAPAAAAAAGAVAALGGMSDVIIDAQAIDARVSGQVVLTTR